MSDMAENDEFCAVCGWRGEDNEAGCLPVGFILQRRYIIGACRRIRSADIQYIAWDALFSQKVFVMEYFPDAETRQLANTNKWASHRDIIPTLLSAATGVKSGISKGRNLFAKEKIPDGAVSFISWDNNGFTIGDKWHGDTLQRSDSCTNEQIEMGEIARAQRALSELIVREGLIAK